MWRFLQRLRLRGDREALDERMEHEAEEMNDLFASLREIEPDAGARSEGRAKLRAAVVTARAERNRPRLAGVRAFSVAAAAIAGSSVLVASAATGTAPLTLVVNVAEWSVPMWNGSPDTVRESVTVESYDPGTGILEGMTVAGVPLTLSMARAGGDIGVPSGGLEPGARIEVTIEVADEPDKPLVVIAVEVVSTPPPDLAREPAPTEEPRPTEFPEPTPVPHATKPADPTVAPIVDDRDEPTIATVEPSPTEPKDDGASDPDLNPVAPDPEPTRTPTPTEEPILKPVEPVEPAPTPTPGSTSLDEADITVTNLETTEDGAETTPDDDISLR